MFHQGTRPLLLVLQSHERDDTMGRKNSSVKVTKDNRVAVRRSGRKVIVLDKHGNVIRIGERKSA